MRIRRRARTGTDDEQPPSVAAQQPARRHRTLVIVTVTAVLASGAGMAASALVKSPEQVAAESGAPTASRLTAQVERRVLKDTVVTRGTVTAARQIEATPAAGGGDTNAQQQVVTAVRTKAGRTVKPGAVLLAVNGRPLIALPGELPAYRDLKPDDRGDDVAALQRALKSLGFGVGGDVTGHFGPGTKSAVTHLYQSAGYDVPDTGGTGGRGDKEKLKAAQDAVDSARRAVDDMRRQIAAQDGGGAHQAAYRTSDGGTSAGTSAGGSGDSGGSAGAGGKGGAGGGTGAGEGEPLAVQLRYLRKALDDARGDQAELIATTGPMLPLNEAVFLPRFPAQVVKLTARPGDTVKPPLITLSSGDLGVKAKMPPDQAGVLKPGMRVSIVSEALGKETAGKISVKGPQTTDQASGDSAAAGADAGGAQPGAGGAYVPVTITPDKALGAAWAGQNVRLTITSAQTGEPVLVVPQSAVSTGADGRTTVSRVDAGGHVTRVRVKPGISGAGGVAVTPVSGGLKAGDRVVTGR